MSIIGHHRSISIPRSEEPASDVLDLLQEQAGKVSPGGMFLFSTNLIKNTMSRSGLDPEYTDIIRTEHYLGIASGATPFVTLSDDEIAPTLTLWASRFLSSAYEEVIQGDIECHGLGILSPYTDIHEPIPLAYLRGLGMDRSVLSDVYPFTLVVGTDAVESHVMSRPYLHNFFVEGRRSLELPEPLLSELKNVDERYVQEKIMEVYYAWQQFKDPERRREEEKFFRKIISSMEKLDMMKVTGKGMQISLRPAPGLYLYVEEFLEETRKMLAKMQ